MAGEICCPSCGSAERVAARGWCDYLKCFNTLHKKVYVLSRLYRCKCCPTSALKDEVPGSKSFAAHHPEVMRRLPEFIKVTVHPAIVLPCITCVLDVMCIVSPCHVLTFALSSPSPLLPSDGVEPRAVTQVRPAHVRAQDVGPEPRVGRALHQFTPVFTPVFSSSLTLSRLSTKYRITLKASHGFTSNQLMISFSSLKDERVYKG